MPGEVREYTVEGIESLVVGELELGEDRSEIERDVERLGATAAADDVVFEVHHVRRNLADVEQTAASAKTHRWLGNDFPGNGSAVVLEQHGILADEPATQSPLGQEVLRFEPDRDEEPGEQLQHPRLRLHRGDMGATR